MCLLLYRILGAKFTLVASRHAATTPSKFTLFLLKKVDKVVTLITSMSKSLGIPNTIVGHGIAVDTFVPEESQKIKIVSQKNIILNVGRVRKAKGQVTLLKALNHLKNYKDWALVIVGKVDKPDFLIELKAIAQQQEIEKQVYFIPETKNIIPYYQAAKIMVAPSFSEGFSLVTAEAMSCENTVIASKNVGVHSQVIHNEKNGYLFTAGNINELKEHLTGLMDEKKKYLGEEARSEIIKNWSAEKEAKKLTLTYLKND